jgi:hypothetical protein
MRTRKRIRTYCNQLDNNITRAMEECLKILDIYPAVGYEQREFFSELLISLNNLRDVIRDYVKNNV